MAYDVIFFDLDGTLCDPGEGIERSAQFALSKVGIDEPDMLALRRFVGPPLQHSFEQYYDLTPAQVQTAINHYVGHFGTEGLKGYSVYAGIPELLEQLRHANRRLCVVTAKLTTIATEILTMHNLLQYFELVHGRGDDPATTKDTTLKLALGEMNVTDKTKAVMVGDRSHDIEAAGLNHIDSVGVLYGYGTEAEFQVNGATHIAKDLKALSELLLHGK